MYEDPTRRLREGHWDTNSPTALSTPHNRGHNWTLTKLNIIGFRTFRPHRQESYQP